MTIPPNKVTGIETIASHMAIAMASKMDAIIHDAINLRIGLDWSMEEMKGRLYIERDRDGIETFFLDNEALMEMHPTTSSFDPVKNGNAFCVKRQYRTC